MRREVALPGERDYHRQPGDLGPAERFGVTRPDQLGWNVSEVSEVLANGTQPGR
jgi:hypothetical protein